MPAFEDGDVVASCQGCDVEGVGDVELGSGTGEKRHQAPEKNVELHIGQLYVGDSLSLYAGRMIDETLLCDFFRFKLPIV